MAPGKLDLPGRSLSSTMQRDYKDEKTLREMYHQEEMSTREIADKCGCSHSAVSYWMEKHDIPRRSLAEANKLAGRGGHPYLYTDSNGYERIQSTEDGKPVYCYLHRLQAVAKYGFEAVKNRDVHHKNGIAWDNRYENIELLTHEEHARLHAMQRSQSQVAMADGGDKQ